MPEGRFEVYEDIASKHRFRLRAINNKIVAVGEAYETKVGCLNGIRAVKKYCTAEIVDLTIGGSISNQEEFEVFQDKAEQYRFRLRAPNNEIVAASESYKTKVSCLNGIEAVKTNCDARVYDLTLNEYIELETVPSKSIDLEVEELKCQTCGMHFATKEELMMHGEMHEEKTEVTDKKTMLGLEEPPEKVDIGSLVRFKGKLLKDGKGVAGTKVELYEKDRSIMRDDYMAAGITGEDGTFDIEWKAKEMDWWDDTAEVYARAELPDTTKTLTSDVHIIKVVGASGSALFESVGFEGSEREDLS